MQTTRLEAFSDGVIAIIITIMVLELHVPHDAAPAALAALLPVLLSYVLSFVTVAIYWVNHHHLIHLVRRVTSRLLWANIHFLFWLSLLPFATGYLGAHAGQAMAVALYGAIAVGCALGYFVMQHGVAVHLARDGRMTPDETPPSRWRDRNLISLGLLLVSVPLAFALPWVATALFCVPPFLYFMPDDRRVEMLLEDNSERAS